MSVKQIAEAFKKKNYLSFQMENSCSFLKMDAKSYSKRGGDKVSLGSMFEEAGLLFDPVQEGTKRKSY